MNQTTGTYRSAPSYKPAPGPASQDSGKPRRDTRALVAVPVIGVAATAVSGFTALVFAGVLSFMSVGNADANVPANAYAHFTDAYLTNNLLTLAAGGALIAAATALAATRRMSPAVLLLCAATAMPWIPAPILGT